MAYQNSDRAQEQLAAIMAASAATYRERAAALDNQISNEPIPAPPSPSRNRASDEHLFVGAYSVRR
jgi:hypothetical protein